jgi:hypothetical protein
MCVRRLHQQDQFRSRIRILLKYSDTSKGAKTVIIDGKETMIKASSFKISSGDEPGHTSEIEPIDTEKISKEGALKSLM